MHSNHIILLRAGLHGHGLNGKTDSVEIRRTLLHIIRARQPFRRHRIQYPRLRQRPRSDIIQIRIHCPHEDRVDRRIFRVRSADHPNPVIFRRSQRARIIDEPGYPADIAPSVRETRAFRCRQ